MELLSAQIEQVALRDTLVVLGDYDTVLRKCERAPFVTDNTDTLEDFVARHDLVSANTRFSKPEARLATFEGCKKTTAQYAGQKRDEEAGAAQPHLLALSRTSSGH